MKTLLETKDITKRFASVIANDNISINIHQGEILALLGENGAGKSTLAEILYGYLQPDSGQIFISDKLSSYLSASTDFSAAPDEVTGFAQNEPEANNTVFSADFIHLAGGVVLTWKRADLTLGASYTGGDQDFAKTYQSDKRCHI